MAHDVRCACIDIGSNTTRLLVAEPDGTGALREVATARALNRLGAGRAGDGTLAPERLASVAHHVASHVEAARAHGAERIAAVATAAVRGAPDSSAVVEQLEAAAGIPVLLLDGDTEARLAFAGATCAVSPRPDGSIAIVDVGGGSTELVVGSCAGGPVWATSIAIGSGLLAEAELHADPPTAAQLDRMRALAAAALAQVDPPPAAAAWAVGGSATSLAQVLGGGDLSRAALARALDALCNEPAATLAARHGLHPERMRMLPAGLVILDAAAERLGVGLQMARGGLREGVILAMLDGTF